MSRWLILLRCAVFGHKWGPEETHYVGGFQYEVRCACLRCEVEQGG